MEREKILNGLRCHAGCEQGFDCDNCDYIGNGDCSELLARDALKLLKEQEAVTIKKTKEHGFGVYGGICPKCRNWIQSAHSFCGFCGQAVKWNDT